METRRFAREFKYIEPIRYLSWLFGKDFAEMRSVDGAEPQIPNSYNSRPNCGNLRSKRLSYTWRRNSPPGTVINK
jgi:hypothetical protein